MSSIPNKFSPRQPITLPGEQLDVPRSPSHLKVHAAGGNGIGWAIAELWDGQAVRRKGWNGKGMYLKLQVPDSESANTLPYVWIRTVQGDRVPWICSQTDLLARDWEVVK